MAIKDSKTNSMCEIEQFQVVRTKSVEYMPLSLSFFLTLSASTWFAYGVSVNDTCITVTKMFFVSCLNKMFFSLFLRHVLKFGERMFCSCRTY